MDRFEDIMDKARAYLNGQMSEPERRAFEQLLAEEPKLRREVELARMIMGGAEELARRRRWKRIRKWGLFGGIPLLLMVVGGLWYFLLSGEPGLAPPAEPAAEDRPAPPGQAGGDSPNRISDRGYSIAWTGDQQLVIIGVFEERAVFGKDTLQSWGGMDIFVASYHFSQGYQWVTQLGGLETWESGRDVTLSPDGGLLITGAFSGTAFFGDTILTASSLADLGMEHFFIGKLSSEGKVEWVSHSGGNLIPHKQTGSNMGNCITADTQGNVIAAGMYLGGATLEGIPLPPGGPNEDLFLAKYTPDGRLLWAKAVTGTYMVRASSIDTDAEGNIYIGGYFGHHNLSGEAIFADTTLQSYGGRDIFLAKYNPNGRLLWVRQAGASISSDGHDDLSGLALDGQQNCYITGKFRGTARFGSHQITAAGDWDMYVAKCSPDGEFLWARAAGGRGRWDTGRAVAVDEKGNAYVTGRFYETARFGDTVLISQGFEDLFVTKIDTDGNFEWAIQAGGPLDLKDTDQGIGIDINPNGRIAVTGYFSGTAIIGGTPYSSRGREDMIFILLDEDGHIVGVATIIP